MSNLPNHPENQEIEPQLFDAQALRSNAEFVRNSIFISTELPHFPEVDDRPLPDHEVWSGSGIGFMTQTPEGAIQDITELAPERQTSAAILSKLDELEESGQWGRATTLATYAQESGLAQDDQRFKDHEVQSARAYLHLGLNEARLLPFDQGDPYDEGCEPLSDVSVKSFCRLVSMAIYYYEQDPEVFEDYMTLASEIHAEMVCRYLYYGDYRHRLWMTLGATDGMHKAKQFLGGRLQAKGPEWIDGKRRYLRSRFESEMRTPGLGRFEALIELGVETGMIEHDVVIEEYERKLSQLDLKVQLIEHLRSMNVMNAPMEYPDITYLRGTADHLVLTDEDLSHKLSAMLNGRLLEVAQTLVSDKSIDVYERKLVQEEISSIAFRMPASDPNKNTLVEQALGQKVQDHIASREVSAVEVDRLIESIYESFQNDFIEVDLAAVWVDRIVDRVVDNAMGKEVTDPVEPLIAVVSVYCRLDLAPFIPSEVLTSLELQLKAAAKASDPWGVGKKSFDDQLLTALSESPETMFKLYWDYNEEYYS